MVGMTFSTALHSSSFRIVSCDARPDLYSYGCPRSRIVCSPGVVCECVVYIAFEGTKRRSLLLG